MSPRTPQISPLRADNIMKNFYLQVLTSLNFLKNLSEPLINSLARFIIFLPLFGSNPTHRLGKEVSTVDFINFLSLIAVNVVSKFVYDWLKHFFKDND